MMKIEINIDEENVYRSYWPPYNIDFTDLRSDVDRTMDSAERALNDGFVTQVTVKIEHYGDEVGTLSVSLE
jgi:hypothetical protein